MPLTLLYTLFDNRTPWPGLKRLSVTTIAAKLITLVALTAVGSEVQAADWGYDDGDKPAGSLAPAKSKASTVKSTASPAKSTASPIKPPGSIGTNSNNSDSHSNVDRGVRDDRDDPEDGVNLDDQDNAKQPPVKALKNAHTSAQAPVLDDSRCWLEIFALCASSSTDDDRKEILQLATLSSDQKNRLKAVIDKKLQNAESKARYSGISSVWKELRGKITAELDTKESYRLLFRALIRRAMPGIVATSKDFSEQLQDLLGPVRIADVGPPPLTEDALNAYADMTCFLYQKRKPNRSVDGDENRQVFVAVVKERFAQAPNQAAKAAMTNFDLTWACFRCRFMDVSESEREKLSLLMASQDSKNSAQLKAELISPTILKIFSLGPWSEKMTGQKATGPKLTGDKVNAEKMDVKKEI